MISEIQRMVGLHLGVKSPAAGDRIVEDLGADSVDVVSIIAAAEERYGLVLDEEVIADIRTVADLAAAVEGGLAKPPGP